MPVCAGIAIYFGIGFAQSLKAIDRRDNANIALILAIALQFVGLLYSPIHQIPSQADRRQGKNLEELILSFKGDVYLSDHPWYLGKLKKPTQAHDMAVRDILRSSGSERWKNYLQHEMTTAITEKRYEAFIVDMKDFKLRAPDFDSHYALAESNLSRHLFHQMTSWDRKPTYLYVKRTDPHKPETDVDKPHD
jgi:hypothetical protein